jgi:dATP pyrophosphohydrolase
MPGVKQSHIEVYVFRRRGKAIEFLCLRRSLHRSLPGLWQPVTGKRRRGERAVQAAVREVREEIGVRPARLWALETLAIYFDPVCDVVRMLPLFAAEIGAHEQVRLSREHDAFRFLTAPAAARRYLWEAQRRGLAAVRREVLERPRLAAALEIPLTARSTTSRRASRPRAPAG